MLRPVMVVGAVLCSGLLLTGDIVIHAEDLPPEYRPCVHKGLEWLAKQQFDDGHWGATGKDHLSEEEYPVAMTALCGIAFLTEGSTLREGKYASRLRRAVDWLVDHSMPNGLIGGGPDAGGRLPDRYMYGHGFSLLFLSCVYGEERDGYLRRQLEDILTRAVEFTGRAQFRNGGWGYVSAAVETGGGSEGSVTITQMQALRAARNAGIVVSKEIMDRGIAFLRASTTEEGGVAYLPGALRPELALTSAGVVCGFSAGEYGSSDLVRRWIKFCAQRAHEVGLAAGAEGAEHVTHDEYSHLYFSQLLYILGDNRYAQWFPDSRPEERLTWSEYRRAAFSKWKQTQEADGSWSGASIGRVYTTALYLTALQLDNGTLPIYQR